VNGQTFIPVVVLGILATSYYYYHRLNNSLIQQPVED